MLNTENTTDLPGKRGRPRKTKTQLPNNVIHIDFRPRFKVGDLVEICGKSLPGNLGKIAVITSFKDEEVARVCSASGMLDVVDPDTGRLEPESTLTATFHFENLRRAYLKLVGA